MSLPGLSTLQKIAVQSYKLDALNDVDGWILVEETPTLKFYMKGLDTVVGIRGTKDSADASADAMLSTGQLESSNRFKEDLKVMTDYANTHKSTNIFGVGHSLGGAILDSFLKKGLIKEGVSYNPAVQPQDVWSILPNRRIYMSGDPLYAIFGKVLRQRPEVRKSNTSFLTNLARFSPIGIAATSQEYLKSHGLKQFEGGVHPEVQSIMGEIAELPAARPQQRIARLKQKVIEGADKLAERKGFRQTALERHGTFNVEVSESARHPGIKLIRYWEDDSVGHDIILRNTGPYAHEYYNPTGEAVHKLPRPVQDFIRRFGIIDQTVRKEHQGIGPICSRASIQRACYGDLTNKQYDEMLIREAEKSNMPIDDYIWKWTQDELKRIGASKPRKCRKCGLLRL
jgi:hypothetical protein